jgi:hypothetical protein
MSRTGDKIVETKPIEGDAEPGWLYKNHYME